MSSDRFRVYDRPTLRRLVDVTRHFVCGFSELENLSLETQVKRPRMDKLQACDASLPGVEASAFTRVGLDHILTAARFSRS